jgi:formate hydrogenlyase subunit 6/NADH:ubiquinone oxidoreductase subunit I
MQKGANSTYFGNLKEGIKSSLKGLRLTMRHFKNARKKMPLANVNESSYFTDNIGTVTLQYPNEVISVPDNGRYRLYNEMDDCIVCDKCAKVCPVDCIDIEPIKSSELIGNASDGSPIRLYAAKFDIDMAKCCFCGLCTTVCPTECLTMTKAYDFSEFDVKDFNYHYANLSPEQAEEKKKNYEQFLAEKEAAKASTTAKESVINTNEPAPKPVFRPSFKPAVKPKIDSEIEERPADLAAETPKPRPVFRPAVKKLEGSSEIGTEVKPADITAETPKLRPVFKPAVKKQEANTEEETENIESPKLESEPIPKPRPIFRPAVKSPEANLEEGFEKNEFPKPETDPAPKPRPIFRPAVKKPKEE